jgi:hypothetical protein
MASGGSGSVLPLRIRIHESHAETEIKTYWCSILADGPGDDLGKHDHLPPSHLQRPHTTQEKTTLVSRKYFFLLAKDFCTSKKCTELHVEL